MFLMFHYLFKNFLSSVGKKNENMYISQFLYSSFFGKRHNFSLNFLILS